MKNYKEIENKRGNLDFDIDGIDQEVLKKEQELIYQETFH